MKNKWAKVGNYYKDKTKPHIQVWPIKNWVTFLLCAGYSMALHHITTNLEEPYQERIKRAWTAWESQQPDRGVAVTRHRAKKVKFVANDLGVAAVARLFGRPAQNVTNDEANCIDLINKGMPFRLCTGDTSDEEDDGYDSDKTIPYSEDPLPWELELWNKEQRQYAPVMTPASEQEIKEAREEEDAEAKRIDELIAAPTQPFEDEEEEYDNPPFPLGQSERTASDGDSDEMPTWMRNLVRATPTPELSMAQHSQEGVDHVPETQECVPPQPDIVSPPQHQFVVPMKGECIDYRSKHLLKLSFLLRRARGAPRIRYCRSNAFGLPATRRHLELRPGVYTEEILKFVCKANYDNHLNLGYSHVSLTTVDDAYVACKGDCITNLMVAYNDYE